MGVSGQTRLVVRYRSGAADVEDIETEIRDALRQLADPASDLAAAAAESGVGPRDFDGATVAVEQEGKGFGDVIVVIAILAPTANHVLRSVWDEVIWPRVKESLGADALREKPGDVSDGDEDDDSED